MMTSSLSRLETLVKPLMTGDIVLRREIETLSERLGLRLPENYLQLVSRYGYTGYWQQFWCILDPRLEGSWTSPADDFSGRNFLSAERVIRQSWPEDVPYPIFPEPGGLLPWASTDNGGRFYWLTEGIPESWLTVYSPDRSGPFQEIAKDIADIVWGLVSGEFKLFNEEFGEDYEYGVGEIVTYLPTGGGA